MALNQKEILENNKQAIQIALSLDKEEAPDFEQKRNLKKFQGWGGLKCLLYPINIDWNTLSNISKADLAMEDDVKQFYAFIEEKFPSKYQEVINNIKEAILTSFYTPQEIPDAIFEKLYENNSEIESFLDPSAGSGIYIDKFIKYFPNCKRIVGVEKDYLTSLILSSIYKENENVTIYNKGFEEVEFKENFDVIASNIPFGATKVYYPNYPKEITDKIHNFFFYRANELLNEKGFLSFITSAGVFNSKENNLIREKLSDQGETINLITLPNNTFESSGTQVTAHLFNYRKDNSNRDDLISKVIEDEEGISLNRYIYKYFDDSFLANPEIGTNPYGDKEYNYTLPLEESINQIKNRIYIPKLSIEHPLSLGEERLTFKPYPKMSLKDVATKQEELQFVQKNISVEDDNFRVIGAIKGKIKGNDKPFIVVSKRRENEYLIESYLNNDIFQTKFDVWENKNDFTKNFNLFLDQLSVFAEKNQVKFEVDFRRIPEGVAFAEYVQKKYKAPILHTFYATDEEINVAYHRSLQKGDISFTENRNPAIVEDIGTNEEGKTYYKLEEIDVTTEEKKYIRKFFGVYDALNRLSNKIDYEKGCDERQIYDENGKKLAQERITEAVATLNKRYDDFVKSYGFLNEQKNSRLNKYLDKYTSLLKSIENPFQKDLFSITYEKADIFKYQFTFSSEHTFSSKSALVRSLKDKKEVDLGYMSELTKKSTQEIIEELGEIIIFNPLDKRYELRQKFLSGDLYSKIAIFKKDPHSNSEEMEKAIGILTDALPPKVPYFAIKKQMGSRWIPIDIIKDFVNDFYQSYFQVYADDKRNSFLVGISNTGKGNGYFEYKTLSGRYIRSEDIIKYAYDDEYPIVTYTIEHSDGTKETKTDEAATNFCKKEISRLQRAYDNYMLNLDATNQKRLEDIYNRTFNNTTDLTFEEDLLDFSDMQLKSINIPEIYPHQAQAIWKMLQSGGGVVDHEVGYGKTLTMIGLSHNLKEMGIAKKPIIIGLKANIGEIARTYKKVYPNAKILYATEKDYNKKDREVFLNRIKTNDWDVVIMSHQQFEKIQQNPQVEIDIIKAELEDLEDNLFQVKGSDISKKQLRALEESKKSLIKRMKEHQDKINSHKDENVLSFDDLGIDHIIIDESHQFKNLTFQTRHRRVAGLGNQNGSQMASNLLTAIRTIQKNTPTGEGGATFFSGTPISNSITELYLLHKFLTPKQLENKKISNFDSWASVFAMKSVEFEVNMVNQITPKERFRYFINVPELIKMYKDMSHIMFGGSLIDRPNKNEYLLENEQTPLQRRFYHKLATFLRTGDQSILNLEKPIELDSKKQALSITAMSLAFKASLDMRLINSSYPDEPNSKVNILVRDLIDKYHTFDQEKGTQIVFSDIGRSNKKLSFEELDYNYKNNIFTSLYDDIKYKLMLAGIPEEEIAFVQDYSDEKKKEILSEKMRKGEIRFLLGGTSNAGTGLNIQDKLIRIAHLTIPWKPSEITQRNGRGYRKGNIIAKKCNNNTIDISYSGTKNTLDNYKMNVNSVKDKFIQQLRSTDICLEREMDEGEIDESTGMNFAEFQAQLSGDTTLLEKYKIDKKIKELESDRVLVASQISLNEKAIDECQQKDKDYDYIIDIMQKDLDKYKSIVQYDEKGTRISEPEYIGLEEGSSTEDIAKFLKQKWESIKKMQEGVQVVVGKFCGFDLVMENQFMGAIAYAINPNNPKVKYDSRSGIINFDKESTTKNFYINCLENIERRLKGNITNKEANLENLNKLQNKVLPTWDRDDELKNLYDQKEYLEKKIRSNAEIQDILPVEQKEINGEMYSISIVKDLPTMENALLKDLLGKEDSMKAIYTTTKVVEVLERLEEKGNIEIHTQYYEEEKGKQYIRFKIKDADKLYIDFVEFMKAPQEEIQNNMNRQIKH